MIESFVKVNGGNLGIVANKCRRKGEEENHAQHEEDIASLRKAPWKIFQLFGAKARTRKEAEEYHQMVSKDWKSNYWRMYTRGESKIDWANKMNSLIESSADGFVYCSSDDAETYQSWLKK